MSYMCTCKPRNFSHVTFDQSDFSIGIICHIYVYCKHRNFSHVTFDQSEFSVGVKLQWD